MPPGAAPLAVVTRLRAANVFGGIRQQRHMACPLQCDSQAALVFRAGPFFAARLDLAAIREEVAQPRYFFIIDIAHVVNTELADLAARAIFAAWARGCASTGGLLWCRGRIRGHVFASVWVCRVKCPARMSFMMAHYGATSAAGRKK
jgi:hypothetical protein